MTTVTSATEQGAAAAVQGRGMFVLDVKRLSPLRAPSSRDAVRDLIGPVRQEDLALLFRHYASLMHAGFSPAEALSKMGNRLTDGRLERFAAEASSRARNGEPLSAVMRLRPLLFPPWVTGLVATAEHSGRFDELLQFTHDELSGAGEFELSYRLPLVYLRTVIVLAVLLCTAGAGVMGGLAGWLKAVLWFALPALCILKGVSLGLCAVARTDWGRPRATSLLAALPGIGAMQRAMAMRRFVRSLQAIHEADRAVQDAYLHSLPVVDSPGLRDSLRRGAEAILAGRAFASALEEAGLLGRIASRDAHDLEAAGRMGELVRRLVEEQDQALAAAAGSAKRAIWLGLALLSLVVIGLGAGVGLLSVLAGGVSQARGLLSGS